MEPPASDADKATKDKSKSLHPLTVIFSGTHAAIAIATGSAVIGSAFGGPVGSAVGAVIGAIAGGYIGIHKRDNPP
jgi:uncharacterized protein YcfJ